MPKTTTHTVTNTVNHIKYESGDILSLDEFLAFYFPPMDRNAQHWDNTGRAEKLSWVGCIDEFYDIMEYIEIVDSVPVACRSPYATYDELLDAISHLTDGKWEFIDPSPNFTLRKV